MSKNKFIRNKYLLLPNTISMKMEYDYIDKIIEIKRTNNICEYKYIDNGLLQYTVTIIN